MQIELTKQQLNNLKIFLDRVELKGQEAVEFVLILRALNNAEEGEE